MELDSTKTYTQTIKNEKSVINNHIFQYVRIASFFVVVTEAP